MPLLSCLSFLCVPMAFPNILYASTQDDEFQDLESISVSHGRVHTRSSGVFLSLHLGYDTCDIGLELQVNS